MLLRRLLPTTCSLVVVLTTAWAPPTAAQAPQRYVDQVFSSVQVTEGIAYGAGPDERGQQQVLRLDLYEPAGDTATDRPTIVLAHGGGFVAGDRGDMAGPAREYARRGYVAVSITYRMDEGSGSITFPPDEAQRARIIVASHDMQAAVRWVRSQASVRRLHPDKVAVGGYSAGAVMAVVTATTPDDPGTSGNPGFSSRVCTAVARAGAGDPDLVEAGDAGALFFHGDDDLTVPYAAALATRDAMAAAGLPTRVVVARGAGHAPPAPVSVAAAWLNEQMVTRTGTCAAPDPAHPPFVRAAFADLLGRAPTGTELGREVARLDAGQRWAELLTRLTRSPEWVDGIVADLYRATLGREPDAAGLAYWRDLVLSGRRRVAQVAASLYASDEYVGTGDRYDWIRDLYQEVLGRQVQPDEVDYWLGQAATNGRTWVTTRIYASVESRRARVGALYQTLLGRAPDAAGLAYWADRIAREGDLALARSLAASAEYGARAATRFP